MTNYNSEIEYIVFVDIITDQEENVYPMIKSGQAHNEMHLSPTSKDTELA